MKQPCMRWTICLQKCVGNCLTRQAGCFQLGIKLYLNSGATRIIPHAANYRNVFLQHPAAPGMIIWPKTAQFQRKSQRHGNKRKVKIKTSPFTFHCKNTIVCNEAVSSILTEGRGAIVSLPMKGWLLDLLYSRLSAIKRILLQPSAAVRSIFP